MGCKRKKINANVELDKPLLDIFDKTTHARVQQTLMVLYSELKVASQENDKKTLQEKLHAIKGIAGQAGMTSALKHIEQVEILVLQNKKIHADQFKALQILFSSNKIFS